MCSSTRPVPAGLSLCAIAAAVLVAHPLAARGEEPVAEAAFLADTLPPGSIDLNLSVTVARGEPPAEGGEAPLVTLPRLQLTLPLGERVGVSADVGLVGGARAGQGVALDTPSLSLKYALTQPGPGATGLSVSADLYGSTHSLADTELGVNVGALRALGGVTLRAALGAASATGRWEPHLHGGVSLALGLGEAWRLFGEAVGTWALHSHEGEARSLALGPSLKRALGERTALLASALVGALGSGRGQVTGLLQLTVSL